MSLLERCKNKIAKKYGFSDWGELEKSGLEQWEITDKFHEAGNLYLRYMQINGYFKDVDVSLEGLKKL